jgi:hypothetical protein
MEVVACLYGEEPVRWGWHLSVTILFFLFSVKEVAIIIECLRYQLTRYHHHLLSRPFGETKDMV